MRARYGIKVMTGALVAQFLWVGLASAQGGTEVSRPGFDRMPRVGIGFVANAPDIMTGASAWTLLDLFGGIGLYADIKGELDTPADDASFLDDVTPAEVEAVPNQGLLFTEATWWSANLAIVRPLSNELMVYVGAGYAERTVYNRYRDETGTFLPPDFPGGSITYWVENADRSESGLNVLGGAFFRLSSGFAVQFGLESRPSGVTIGGSYSLAFR